MDWMHADRSSWRRVLVTLGVLLTLVAFALWVSYSPSGTAPIGLMGMAALLASVIALYGEAIRDWMWGPRLAVSYVHGPDYCESVKVVKDMEPQLIFEDCYYFRLFISNRGQRRAEKVEVLVTDLRKRQDDGSWPVVRRYSMNLKWTHIGKPILDGLSPAMERFCDVGYIRNPSTLAKVPVIQDLPAVNAGKAVFILEVETQPFDLSYMLEPGEYQIMLFISAEHHWPIRKILSLNISGKWHDDRARMLAEGIDIRLT